MDAARLDNFMFALGKTSAEAGVVVLLVAAAQWAFRRIDSGTFILYSVGWNETDDGGKTAITKDGVPDNLRGDWVFEYPN